MRTHLTSLITIVTVSLIFPAVTFGQRAATRAAAVPVVDNRPFDRHDLSGYWSRGPERFLGPSVHCVNCGDRGFGPDVPPFTPEGQARFDSYKPSRGRLLGTADAAAHPEEHIGRRRAVVPALANDPTTQCNPQGMPRIMLFEPSPFEIVQNKDRMFQFHEWSWVHREIWTDGRKLPDQIDYLGRWMGYSVGKWEGDTFVVDSVGFDDRAWVDYYGYPQSDQMRLQERYRRTSYDTMELSMTITDPKYYTKPWVSETKRFKLIPKEKMAIEGWVGLLEDFCVPFDEIDTFNKEVRDPAGGITH